MNQKAIEAVFGDGEKFNGLMSDALANFYDDLDEETSFEEAVELFCERARNVLAEAAACDACGVDLGHWLYRNCGSEMQPDDVQAMINGHVKCFDVSVKQMFKALEDNNIGRAYGLFVQGFGLACENVADLTREQWKGYLMDLSGEVNLPDFGHIIADFEHRHELWKLAQRLDVNLAGREQVKRGKI